MIWYRHWVEMRLGVLLFAGLCLWLGISIVGPLVGLVLPLVTERFSPALLSLIQSG